eukprot:COSAG01_NODE_828_length_13273_cov_231.615484_8_plen_57_part_00
MDSGPLDGEKLLALLSPLPPIRVKVHLSYLLYIQFVPNFVTNRNSGKLGHCTNCCT